MDILLMGHPTPRAPGAVSNASVMAGVVMNAVMCSNNIITYPLTSAIIIADPLPGQESRTLSRGALNYDLLIITEFIRAIICSLILIRAI